MNKRKFFWITGLVLIALIVFLTLRFNRFYQKLPPLAEDIVITVPEPKLLYGLPADSFHIEESTVERNQNLSDILIERGVTAQAVDQLAKNSVSVFDVRKMKTGNQYTIFYSKDEARSPLFLAYQNNSCLLYTSDAADEEDSVDLGGRRIIKKKKTKQTK